MYYLDIHSFVKTMAFMCAVFGSIPCNGSYVIRLRPLCVHFYQAGEISHNNTYIALILV